MHGRGAHAPLHGQTGAGSCLTPTAGVIRLYRVGEERFPTMKLTMMTRRLAHLGLVIALPLAATTVRIIQTNSAGDDVSIIDPVTNKVVGTIHGIEVNHGAA